MQNWILWAFSSMFFAGLTAVIAKKGLEGISADMGLGVRTLFVFVLTIAFCAFVVPGKDWSNLKMQNWLWLAASAVTTTLSWIFYYRAVKIGEVSTVALIDKGSVLISVALAVIFFHEALNMPKMLGAGLIVCGLLCIARG